MRSARVISGVCAGLLAGAAADARQELPDLPAFDQIPVTVQLDFYEVEGRSRRELEISLRDSGPVGMDAETHYLIAPGFSYEQTETGCEMFGFNVSIDITITYPRFVRYDSASRSMRRDWDERLDVLEDHENGHARLAVLGAYRMREAVRAIPTDQSCEDFSAQAQATIRSHQRDIAGLQRSYDRATNHGRQQASYDWAPVMEELAAADAGE